MNLYLHESIHLTLSLLAGYLAWLISGNPLSFVFGLLGGFFVDIDHLFDYFMAFGTKFNLSYFLKGYSFLKTDKIYVLLHSWELVLILFVLTFQRLNVFTFQPLLLSFSLSMFFHLCVDAATNDVNAWAYFLLYRLRHNFELKTLVTNAHYQKHLIQKKLTTYH